VVVWAAYFVPLVLRRYDEAGKSTAIDKLSPLSRTVARRDRRPNAGQEATMHTAEQRSSRVESARVESARVEYSSRSARIAARRGSGRGRSRARAVVGGGVSMCAGCRVAGGLPGAGSRRTGGVGPESRPRRSVAFARAAQNARYSF